jgi:hypothetical protein
MGASAATNGDPIYTALLELHAELDRLRRDFDIEIEVNGVLRRELAEAQRKLASIRAACDHTETGWVGAPGLRLILDAAMAEPKELKCES